MIEKSSKIYSEITKYQQQIKKRDVDLENLQNKLRQPQSTKENISVSTNPFAPEMKKTA